jgi:pimeloyl-ACP methyl ester carboxylesterase
MSTRNAPDRFLERGDIRLRWRLEGSGPPLALLHGWALDLEYWDPLAALLAPRFTVLRFDRRGFGLSTGLPDIHSNVADLKALLGAAAIDRALLVGMSQGARLAIHFALAFPAHARALLLDGAPALEAESDLPLARYRNTLETLGPVMLQADLLLHPLMQLQTPDPARQALLARCVARYQGLDLLHPAKRGLAPEMSALATPVLILNGSRDTPSRREAGRRLQAAIPGAQRMELPGGGHLAQLDDPVAYARIVEKFCAVLPP